MHIAYKHDTSQSKLFYVKKANTTHRLLSITVRGIHVWNGLASNIRQLPSLQQFKKSLKSTLLSSYLWTINTMEKQYYCWFVFNLITFTITITHFRWKGHSALQVIWLLLCPFSNSTDIILYCHYHYVLYYFSYYVVYSCIAVVKSTFIHS